jgi:hypothetical protein
MCTASCDRDAGSRSQRAAPPTSSSTTIHHRRDAPSRRARSVAPPAPDRIGTVPPAGRAPPGATRCQTQHFGALDSEFSPSLRLGVQSLKRAPHARNLRRCAERGCPWTVPSRRSERTQDPHVPWGGPADHPCFIRPKEPTSFIDDSGARCRATARGARLSIRCEEPDRPLARLDPIYLKACATPTLVCTSRRSFRVARPIKSLFEPHKRGKECIVTPFRALSQRNLLPAEPSPIMIQSTLMSFCDEESPCPTQAHWSQTRETLRHSSLSIRHLSQRWRRASDATFMAGARVLHRRCAASRRAALR